VSTATGQTICRFHWPNFYESIIWTGNNISSWPIKYSCRKRKLSCMILLNSPTPKTQKNS